jgi:3-dehydroquinate synthase
MERIRLPLSKQTDHSYEVVVGRGVLQNLCEEVHRLGSFSSYAVVTDEQVRPLVAEPLLEQLGGINPVLLTMAAGEAAKTMETVLELCRQLLAAGFDRKSLLLAVGGGVVGDIAGFTAAVYLRGIDYVQIPTTLLAQVDSAIGGKTAVDLPVGKNLLGAFHQPLLVLCDPDLLASLPLDAMRQGMAETIKSALIGDADLFSLLETEGTAILNPANPALETVITRACRVKCTVVSQDEHEKGLRRILNFGHTLGHAVETASNYGIGHGQAVAAGMGVAIRFSRQWAGLDRAEADRALGLIETMGLPTEPPPDLNGATLLAALERDKKIQAGICHFVLLAGIGCPVTQPIPLSELRRHLEGVAGF